MCSRPGTSNICGNGSLRSWTRCSIRSRTSGTPTLSRTCRCRLSLTCSPFPRRDVIGNDTYALLSHPEQADLLRARPELAANAVEELLRFDAPRHRRTTSDGLQTKGRSAITPTRIADTAIEPGLNVLTLLGSVNCDPSRFDAPNTLDITRADIVPLSFGAGIHYCLGAQLTRMEGAAVFPRLLNRLPRLAIGDQVHWRPGLTLRGPVSLTVEAR